MVLVLGLSFVSGHRLNIVTYLTIITVVARMLLPPTKGALYTLEADNAVVVFKAIVSTLGTKPLSEPSSEQAGEPKDTDVVLRDVSLSYEKGRPVSDGVSLTTKQGGVTALVGPSGAGKLTVLCLTARFWDVTAGMVSISGADVCRPPAAETMAMISMVFQEVCLFDTTIHENPQTAQPNVIDERLEEAARRASPDKVIEVLPHGWDTPVGPGGVGLSGGERQRVSTVRAFLKDAPILLLGEIISAPDNENGSAITEVIRELSRGRTVLVAAHQLSTIWQADRVVFLEPSLDDARVAQAGTVPRLITRESPSRGFVKVYTATPR